MMFLNVNTAFACKQHCPISDLQTCVCRLPERTENRQQGLSLSDAHEHFVHTTGPQPGSTVGQVHFFSLSPRCIAVDLVHQSERGDSPRLYHERRRRNLFTISREKLQLHWLDTERSLLPLELLNLCTCDVSLFF